MGLIHFHVRHYAMAVRFFQHALQFDQKATESLHTDAPVHAIGASKQPEILYNLGIAMLHLQRPKEAFECFLIPLNYYHNNPKLWLRLAEACIMVHKEVKLANISTIRISKSQSISCEIFSFSEFKIEGEEKYRIIGDRFGIAQKVHHKSNDTETRVVSN